jgi:hypothetical protein
MSTDLSAAFFDEPRNIESGDPERFTRCLNCGNQQSFAILP